METYSYGIKCDTCKGIIDTEKEIWITIHNRPLNIDSNVHYACFLLLMRKIFNEAIEKVET